jgi:hypothetical protein
MKFTKFYFWEEKIKRNKIIEKIILKSLPVKRKNW